MKTLILMTATLQAENEVSVVSNPCSLSHYHYFDDVLGIKSYWYNS